MKKTLSAIAVGLLLLAAALQLSGHGYIWRALTSTYLQGHRTAHIDDAKNFDQRVIAKGLSHLGPRTLAITKNRWMQPCWIT